MKDIITESIRYWEPRRLVYNAALGLVVLGMTLYHHPSLSTVMEWQAILGLMRGTPGSSWLPGRFFPL